MNELTFKRQLVKFLRDGSFIAFRIENKLEHGMPDILVDRNAKQAVWIEAKCGTEPLNRNQEIWINQHVEAWGIVLEARLVDGNLTLIRYTAGAKRKPQKVPLGTGLLWQDAKQSHALAGKIYLTLDRLE